MKKTMLPVLCILLGFMLASCGKESKGADPVSPDEAEEKAGLEAENFRDFYYTEENINYNAFYQRYRVYDEDGKHMFFHETRQVENDYGPATEKDTTLKGCFELTKEEWEKFLGFLERGSASSRQDDPVDGDSGPWLFLYLKDGDPEGYVYSFSTCGTLKEFEDWCALLVEEGRYFSGGRQNTPA